MKKELRPFHDHVTCAVCGRTMLKGERTESFLASGGDRHVVCELCFVRAEHAGWLRESVHGDTPARGPRQQQRRPLLSRLRRRSVETAESGPAPQEESPSPEGDAIGDVAPNGESPAPEPEPEPVPPAPAPPPPPVPRRERGPRHVRAVPTTAEVKVERALEVFNASEHQRTVSGLSRSLGAPWVTAVADLEASSTVTVLVAWELSWYRYRVDLGEAVEAVALQAKGDELDDIEAELREWNAGLDEEGALVMGVRGE
ncbi:MAG: hypothetical protein ACR2LH_01675 [Thermoleophilaceae bacterium]